MVCLIKRLMYVNYVILLIFFGCFDVLAHDQNSSKPLRIAFFINKLSFRGTEVSTYNYAHYNETILGNESFIINRDMYTYNEVREHFKNRFVGRFFDGETKEQIDEIIRQNNIDIFYVIKTGNNDGIISSVCKNAIHAVFDENPSIHGDAYACVSPWLAQTFSIKGLPCVPHIVDLPNIQGDLRTELNISRDATVFGYHGGHDSFNIGFVQEAVIEIAHNDVNKYFIFLGVDPFCSHERVIFLPVTADNEYKVKFINSCDAMLHARSRGETFGMACAEFSIKNKPVITWSCSPEKSHIQLLGDVGVYYANKDELLTILKTFDKYKSMYKNWDVYSKRFNPYVVIKRFEEIFIKPFFN
jgi:glycosyltransferase involved in cell wall biosynthesis